MPNKGKHSQQQKKAKNYLRKKNYLQQLHEQIASEKLRKKNSFHGNPKQGLPSTNANVSLQFEDRRMYIVRA